MNKIISFSVLIAITFIILLLQTTLLSPSSEKYFYPDLNLIFIILLALRNNIPGAVFIVLLNGYVMDVMSGYMLGINTFSRLATYLLIRGSGRKVDLNSISLQFVAFFGGTVLTWLFIVAVFATKFSFNPNISLELILSQATINSILGLSANYLIQRSYAKLQK